LGQMLRKVAAYAAGDALLAAPGHADVQRLEAAWRLHGSADRGSVAAKLVLAVY